MTELEAMVDEENTVMRNPSGNVNFLCHLFEFPSRSRVAVCLTFWKEVSTPFDSNSLPRIKILKGRPRKLINGSFQVGEYNIGTEGAAEDIESLMLFNKFINKNGGEEAFSREIAKEAVFSYIELSNA